MQANKKIDIRKITVTAIMVALSYGLMFIEFAIPSLIPPFIKLDVSELPALITSFAFGPVWGVVVCLLKNLIHLLQTQTGGIGELSNFLLGATFVFVAGLFYKIKHNRKFAFIGSLVGALSMALISFVTNAFVVYPFYEKMFMPEEVILGMYQKILPSMHSINECLLVFNVPFTFAKGLISVVITFIIYHKISPILKGKKQK